jgi:hypothetical protein
MSGKKVWFITGAGTRTLRRCRGIPLLT